MTDIVLLQDCIEKSGYKRNYLAERLGITPQGFYNKCHGQRDFTVKEILVLCDVLNISNDNREKIFFNVNVDETSTNEEG